MCRGGRTGPSTIDPIDQAVENPFYPFFHAYFSIQAVIHDGIRKTFAYAVVWVIGTAICFKAVQGSKVQRFRMNRKPSPN